MPCYLYPCRCDIREFLQIRKCDYKEKKFIDELEQSLAEGFIESLKDIDDIRQGLKVLIFDNFLEDEWYSIHSYMKEIGRGDRFRNDIDEIIKEILDSEYVEDFLKKNTIENESDNKLVLDPIYIDGKEYYIDEKTGNVWDVEKTDKLAEIDIPEEEVIIGKYDLKKKQWILN